MLTIAENNSKQHIKTTTIVQLALLSGIIVVLAATPLGLINLGIIYATIVHVPVIIGAIVLGPKAGAFLGGVFAMTSLVKNTIQPNLSSFVFSPFYSLGDTSGNFWSLVVCFVPRILIGIVAGYIFIWISKHDKTKIFACAVAGLLGSLTNTIFVMGGIFLFFANSYADAQKIAVNELFGFIAGIVGAVGVPEAIVASVLAALISKPLLVLLKRSKM